MFVKKLRKGISGALLSLIAATASSTAFAASAEKPVAGKQVYVPNGVWSTLPQIGPNGKVRQCVLVSPRQRQAKDGPVDTRFAVNISAGASLVITIQDDELPTEQVLDDQAEVLIDGLSSPAVGFRVGTAFAFHRRAWTKPKPSMSLNVDSGVSRHTPSKCPCRYSPA